MRKLLLVLTSLVLALGLSACGDDDDVEQDASSGSDATVEEGGTPDFETMEEGKLIVGTELPAPPFWNGDDYGDQPDGYEVDLAREIAERLGLDEVEFVEMPFDGLVSGAECPCDFGLSQVTITEERAEAVDFSAPYFDADQGVMVKSGTEVASIEDAAGLKWGVQITTTGADFLDETVQPDQEANVYDTVTDLFNALRGDQVDAVMMDTPIVLGAAADDPDADFEVVGQFKTGETYGAVLAKDSPNTDALSDIIEELREEGFLGELAEKYFGGDPAEIPVIE